MGFGGQDEGVASLVDNAANPDGNHAVDLSRLNNAERIALQLLAEGHTAKSVANVIGSTATAVHERLREARRKTGVGSSRELARLLKAQENCDEQMGVCKDPLSTALHPELQAQPWRLKLGVVVMSGLFVVAAAVAALTAQGPGVTTSVEDPLLGAPLVDGPNVLALHRKVRSEPRDPSWAPRLETAVRARVMQIPLVGRNGNVLRVTCGTSLCEIGGTLVSPADRRELEDQKSQHNQTVKDLQVSPLPDDLGKLGLKMETALFTSGRGKPDKAAFLIYYSRKERLRRPRAETSAMGGKQAFRQLR